MATSLKLQIPLPPRFFDHPGDPRVRWTNWKAQLDNFFMLTNMTLPKGEELPDHAKNSYLSALLGSEGCRILMAHPVATKAPTMTYADFTTEVQKLFERPPNPVRAEYDFRNRKQAAGETVSEFLTALRTLFVHAQLVRKITTWQCSLLLGATTDVHRRGC